MRLLFSLADSMLIAAFPQVSCLVPCFNEDIKILEESLNSLKNQSFKDFECILIDESTDQKIVNACRSFCEDDARFIYVHPPKRVGLAGSLNLGIEMARGRYIARFDSDDICSPDRFALQVEFLDQNIEIGVVGSSIEIVDIKGQFISRRDYPLEHVEIEKKFIFSNALAHPTVMFRKSLLTISGGAYDSKFRYAEDLEFWLRLLNHKVKFANLAGALVKYRQQETNRVKDNWKYNLKARIKNFSSPYKFIKILAILGIVFWMVLPVKIQRALFKVIQLRKF